MSGASASSAVQPRSIWAVGKNYEEHIKELPSIGLNIGQEVPKEPVIFLKSGACLYQHQPGGSQPVPLPLPTHFSSDIHHEVELAVQLGPELQPARVAIALDLTARDVQAELKRQGYPWTLAKSFAAACPCGPWADCTPGMDLQDLTLRLEVNGQVRQQSSTCHMIFKVRELLRYLRARFPLEAGDVLLTGTPAGVGRLQPGDLVAASLTTSAVAGGEEQVLSSATWVCTATEQPQAQA